MNNQKTEWDQSYNNKDNFVFYPHEEVIRFVSKYIRKRVGLNNYLDIRPFDTNPKILDLGCGIGRHVIYASQMGLETYGIDLSAVAIELALHWGAEENILGLSERVKRGDIRRLPWADSYFDYVISNGVLDSMHFAIAKETIAEVYRVLRPEGLFYCDLISGDNSTHSREYEGEEIVSSKHEEGTIQLYFNYAKINGLVKDYFEIVECNLIRKENVVSGNYSSRYHLVLMRR
ncbi:MAG: methyltransferase type 11 [Desulfosporosinus sp. BRH_c37]|nr:MAG: methyltransferase type 11 [Desulfosporosinus sp. BRH_c37]